jgi:hypothetical protein
LRVLKARKRRSRLLNRRRKRRTISNVSQLGGGWNVVSFDEEEGRGAISETALEKRAEEEGNGRAGQYSE